MPTPVRVRFAPSPTGHLHVGGARTALYNYLYARHHGGEFILRIEDTDEARSTEESMRLQIADLAWLGFKWSEGPDPESFKDRGPYGPYRQSERKHIYREHAEKLLADGRAYYCFMTDAEIEIQRAAALAAGRPPQVQSPYRDLPLAEARAKLAAGEAAVVRYRVTEHRDYKLSDLVRGEVTFPSDMVGDFVLLRSTGVPVYNFCCAIDDALMKITHVFRAEEHLSNTLRQMMIYEAFGYPLPQFGHLSIILGADRQKLSKRHGATSCHEYMTNGYLPEALNNFVALLGWSSPAAQEILSMNEMIAQFTPDRLNASPAVFDETKLRWVNATHLRGLPDEELWRRLDPFLTAARLQLPTDSAWRARALAAFRSGMHTLRDATEPFQFLGEGPLEVTAEGRETFTWPTTRAVVREWRDRLAARSEDFLSEADFASLQDAIRDALSVKGKPLFQPIRVAVIGRPQGTELKMLVPLLHRDVLIARADQVLAMMDQ